MKSVIPLFIFAVIIGLLSIGLQLNPTNIPSQLIGKTIPDFSGKNLFDNEQLITEKDFLGEPALVSFWATWCTACIDEHPFLVSLAKEAIPIYGINYKDDNESAINWLEKDGNPYRIVVNDDDGRIGIEWGVYAVPEIFVIDATGVVRNRFIWPVSKEKIYQSLSVLK